MTIPPETQFRACMDVLRHAIVQARVWGRDGNVPAEQLADLMDAIHHIPGVVQNFNACGDDDLKRQFETYERKWGKSDGPCLLTLYQQRLTNHSTQSTTDTR